MTAPRLTYFGLRGRAEAIRLFLHATGTSFEDHRVESASEWKALKPRLPLGVLPIYESDHRVLHESQAILRHLGRARTPALDESITVEVEACQDAFGEAQEDYWRFAWVKNYYDHLERYADETLRPRLERFSRWFRRDGEARVWWAGGAFSHADCVAWVHLDEVDAFFPSVLSEFSELQDFHARLAGADGISQYLASENRPAVFGMGSMGPKVDPRTPLAPQRKFENPWTEPLDLQAFLRNQRRL